MAGPYYVDSIGGDDSTGASWATAFATLAQAASASAAGEKTYVASDHTEDEAASKTIDFAAGTKADPCLIISADKTSGAVPVTYETMAEEGTGSIKTTSAPNDIAIYGFARFYGLYIYAKDFLNLGTTSEETHFIDCKLEADDTMRSNATSEAFVLLDGCEILQSASSGDFYTIATESELHVRNCTFPTTPSSNVFESGGHHVDLLVEDSDLSYTNSILFGNLTNGYNTIVFRRCKLHADHLGTPAIYDGTIGHTTSFILIESCKDGTEADDDPTIGLNYYADYYGTIIRDTAVYWTGGASNGTDAFSWKMTCNANTTIRFAPLRSPQFAIWAVAGSHTVNVHITHNYAGDSSDLQDDQIWLEISHAQDDPGEGSNIEARYDFVTTLPAILAAASDVDNESDGWNSHQGVIQLLTKTVVPDKDGWIIVRVCLATGLVDDVWINPQVELT